MKETRRVLIKKASEALCKGAGEVADSYVLEKPSKHFRTIIFVRILGRGREEKGECLSQKEAEKELR